MQIKCHPAVEAGGGGSCLRSLRFELYISFIWELNVFQHPSNLGFVSTFPWRQRERERVGRGEGGEVGSRYMSHTCRTLFKSNTRSRTSAHFHHYMNFFQSTSSHKPDRPQLISISLSSLSSHQHTLATANSPKRCASAEQMNLFHCCP